MAGVNEESPEINDLEEAESLLSLARWEIQELRRRINILAPKAQAYDNLSKVIGLIPENSRGESVDLAWQINYFLSRNADKQEGVE